MDRPWFRIALQYSTARMSLGRRRHSARPPIWARAWALAAGKLRPSFRFHRRYSVKSRRSSSRAVSRISSSGDSAPKHRAVAPAFARISTPPAAKPSAEDRHTPTGSSSTRSAPAFSAALARRVLSKIAGEPRWTKFPLIRHTMASSGVSRCRTQESCRPCPRWKGLYSQMIPTILTVYPPLPLSAPPSAVRLHCG